MENYESIKTKIEIKSIFGNLIFEFEKENNTIKDTLLEAIKCGAYLRGAYLRDADLRGADLRDADLRDADLCGAYLRGAYLCGANNDIAGKIEDWMSHDNIGSRNSRTLFFKTDKGVFVRCGCFRGDLEKFIKKVKETHGDSKHARDYLALVEFIKIKFDL